MDNAAGNYDHNPAEIYKRLNRCTDEIRLVRINSVDQAGRVACSIQSYSLLDAPKYTALSYTWGRPDRDCSIDLGMHACPVRKNLLGFLRQAASSPRHSHELFWIDALCIDQDDQAERTHQVGLMSMIYRRADYVLVWLGPAHGNSKEALRGLRRQSASSLAKVWWTTEGAAIRRLCQRAYWSRLWVLQELALAQRIQLACGDQEVSWEHFMTFMENAKRLEPFHRNGMSYEYLPTMESPAALMLNHIRNLDQCPTLSEQMLASRQLCCSDQRDKIFALLGIVRLSNPAIVPDYTIDMSILLNMVLRDENQHRAPRSLKEVRGRCTQLTTCMDIPLDTILAVHNTGEICSLEQITGLEWAHHYRHHDIEDLWYEEAGTIKIQKYFLQAAEDGATRAFSILLHSGRVDLDCCYTDGRTALHLAAASGHHEAVCFLLQHWGVDVNKRDSMDQTPLCCAVIAGHTEIISVLLAVEGIDCKWEEEELWRSPSLLHKAAEAGREDVLRLLLLRLPDIEVNNDLYWLGSPITCAAQSGSLGAVHALLDHPDVDVNGSGDSLFCRSPLTAAAENGHEDIVETLLACEGIDVNKKGNAYMNALGLACEYGYSGIAKMLLGRSQIAVNQRSRGETPLHRAATGGHLECVEWLLQHSDIAVNELDEDSRATALHMAITGGHTSVVQTIIEHRDVDMNIRDKIYGHTPLMHAILGGMRDIMVEILLKRRDIDINVKDKDGDRPLDVAERYSYRRVVQLLVYNGKAKRSWRGRTRSILQSPH
ncbi:Ankyrin repeat domain-containing protein 17 [Pseudocercospora fuligena]|uniref:Ankyrin repeat domain-containing protein 17 n=1 Tax=Pseudocercospora fuligena TaxID=685502 RepID=A0A8H6VPN9_9PEZI|nr:Ankyrin repeat domain-containing protein 17 [Pseudocercospora fuligena]